MIDANEISLCYPNNKGIFDVSFQVKEGETVGYLGPNGAGKTTTLRCILGFSKPDKGVATIGGLDCYRDAPKIQRFLGYVPGEISFFDGMRGHEFLRFLSDMRGQREMPRAKELIDLFELDTRGKIKRYSKGMKQKLGIIAALMHDPQVIVLDEPTSGLDPLMQNTFVELILSEKKRGKTILMSSHIFDEVERTCDRVFIIKSGVLVAESTVFDLKNTQISSYIVELVSMTDLEKFHFSGCEVGGIIQNKVEFFVRGEEINRFLQALSQTPVVSFQSKAQSLEDVFLNLYKKEEENEVSPV